MEAFDSSYKQTFDMSRASVTTIMKLFLERERVLHAINDIRFLLPNDLDDEIDVARLHDDVDRSLMENIRDAKERLHVFFTPGPMSTASKAINYRAANDIVV